MPLSEKPLVKNFIETPDIDSGSTPLSIGPELAGTIGKDLGYEYEAILGI
jgi:hypothetical protein